MEIKYRTELGRLLNHLGLKGDAVEIGVAEGRNAAILMAMPEVSKLYLIDTWTHLEQDGDGSSPQEWHENNYKEAQERIAEVLLKDESKDALFLRGKSVDMIKKIPDESLVLAYIDGDHSFDGCLTDLKAIYQKVKSGGVIAGHDYLNRRYGVHQAVPAFANMNKIPLSQIHTIQEDEMPMAGFWFIKP